MNMSSKLRRLRCTLCKKGLLQKYNVYDVPIDKYGASGEPVLYSTLTGYFYRKSNRTQSEVLDIPGNISECQKYTYKIIAFELTFKVTDLVDISGTFYKIIEIDMLYGICYSLTLEVWANGLSH